MVEEINIVLRERRRKNRLEGETKITCLRISRIKLSENSVGVSIKRVDENERLTSFSWLTLCKQRVFF